MRTWKHYWDLVLRLKRTRIEKRKTEKLLPTSNWSCCPQWPSGVEHPPILQNLELWLTLEGDDIYEGWWDLFFHWKWLIISLILYIILCWRPYFAGILYDLLAEYVHLSLSSSLCVRIYVDVDRFIISLKKQLQDLDQVSQKSHSVWFKLSFLKFTFRPAFDLYFPIMIIKFQFLRFLVFMQPPI